MLLNLLLAGLTAAAGWRLREDWLRDRQHASAVLQSRVKPVPPPTLVPLAVPAPYAAPAYADVAQKDLFSKDRNPNVIIEPVAVKPKPKWPTLPVLYGVMGLPGGMIAMMSEKAGGRSHGVGVGDKIGEFKLVALNGEKVSFEFQGETQEANLRDLLDRTNAARDDSGGASTSMNPANIAAQRGGPPPPPKPGTDIGAQMKACQPGDTSPAGTLVDGFKKVLEKTPFGDACRWVSQ